MEALINNCPRPTAMAWKIIFCYRAFEAALQLLLPGKRVEGPVSPTGNRPVYKVHVAPSSSDSGSCRNLIIDFYWGMELYPRIGKKFDIKVFTNCRFTGFYICWGCLVWVPSIYTSPGMYLVNHPVQLGTQLAIYILVAGILCIYINYDCDRQRQEFRRTNRKCSFLPYFYVIYLTILLFDRAKRDDDRCRSKYGKYWKFYCEKVRHMIVPGIY
ncbi:LOW QUALITY PROTEIN: hypothetical protein HID58_018326 [Brassica napus]|uniref:7-dehydrocholesterol reductase n=1 Tax=Brassica napus TaxID=3708 RepID=A0ABQ8D9M1_BRANA|nr:LOW QUALITY PROTEIN: hypothetical protein HID58_018326 [Brassica napus]